MPTAKTLLIVPLLACSLASAPAQAQEHENPDTLQSEPQSVSPGVDPSKAPPAKTSASGIEYRSGGVGKEERDALHLAASRYPLKIVLSEGKDAAFMHDVNVRVAGQGAKPVFEADGVGPLVFVNVPPGSYEVAVSARGQTKQQSVSLGADKQTAISFSW